MTVLSGFKCGRQGLRREVVDMAGPVSVLAGDELIQRAEASIW